MNKLPRFETHIVENQPFPMPSYNLWQDDELLKQYVLQHVDDYNSVPEALLTEFGAIAGDSLMHHGDIANKNKPVLHAFDRYGRRIDHIEFHPSYHVLMDSAMAHNVHNYSWRHASQRHASQRHTPRTGAHVVRAALMYMHYQAESGTSCPLTMTHAAVPALRYGTNIPSYWLDKLINGTYDSRDIPAKEKNGLTIGMGMTEKSGGSDVRRNTTTATKQADGSYLIVGHKFFFSAPMCDGHLILAQAEGGLSCFLLPRRLENGELNKVRIQRLKDKLGDWSNASSEVEFQEATAYLLGEEGRGVRVIIDMVSLTRLDCMIGSSALMRQALAEALHHVKHRDAFGNALINQPLMQNVLTDLTLESAAATAFTMRVAKAVDKAETCEHEAALARIATAIGKYWVCKRTVPFVNEAQECMGGIGYVEENPMPRYYRQAPLNSIWEGSGNVQCLDVLRALAKEPDIQQALFKELMQHIDKNSHYKRHIEKLKTEFEDTSNLEIRSRYITEQTALALQASVLLQSDNVALATLFCRARLGGEHGYCFGSLPADAPFNDILSLV
jgi:putative acyl-CoA dehydrogenase